jgi:hypothetical protein
MIAARRTLVTAPTPSGSPRAHCRVLEPATDTLRVVDGSHCPLGPRRRLGVLAALSVAFGLVAAGCSSSPAADKSATTTTALRHHQATTTTSTTVPSSTTTAPPVQSSDAQIQIMGSSATISFTSSDISGSISPGTGTFSDGDTLYTFTVSGVQFTGSPATSTATGGLIGSVTVAQGSGGATVAVKLTSPAAHASYGLGHNEVGVTFS